MREYTLNLAEYEISKQRYRELLAACRQYEERRQKIMQLYQPKGMTYTGMPHGSGTSSPVEKTVFALDKLKEKQRAIETAAVDAAPEQWLELLKNVTQGIPYEKLSYYGGKRQFYETRRKFFFLLDKIY